MSSMDIIRPAISHQEFADSLMATDDGLAEELKTTAQRPKLSSSARSIRPGPFLVSFRYINCLATQREDSLRFYLRKVIMPKRHVVENDRQTAGSVQHITKRRTAPRPKSLTVARHQVSETLADSISHGGRRSPSRTLDSYVEVRHSTIHGLGVFAKRDIPKNTVWWKATRNNVILLNQKQFATFLNSESNATMDSLTEIARVYGYYSMKLESIIVCLDNARYVNHSSTPNSGAPLDGNPLSSITLRDIFAGEEITEDYNSYDACPWSDLTCSDSFLDA